ncbi:MAG: hypothetical protein Q4D71_06030 [Oscillospiraceae bacterium]|nr:hypothetical protein [Oscillospiraceae bacterium]
MTENKKCWACKRILVGESKTGLCPDCINKYGTPIAGALAVGAGIGAGVGGKKVVKHAGKIIRIAVKVMKH